MLKPRKSPQTPFAKGGARRSILLLEHREWPTAHFPPLKKGGEGGFSRDRSDRSPLWRSLGLALALLSLGACASVPFDQPKTFSTALADTESTLLGQRVAEVASGEPDESGFYLLGDGIEALAARLLLMRAAERSLDVQYYFILDGLTARLFVRELLNAADRGVRVRLLLDDISTSGYEAWMTALEGHANIEIRLFNPFSRRKTGYFDWITDHDRVQHRMHNKSFTVDSQATIVGGRNIGDEYFSARTDLDFVDLDLLGFGPVAKATSKAFDEYWNSYAAVSVSLLVKQNLAHPTLEQIRRSLDETVEEARTTPYGEALTSQLLERLQRDGQSLEWAVSSVVHDPPDKAAVNSDTNENELLALQLAQAIDIAEKEFLLVSPYFVPMQGGVELLTKLEDRGVRVVVVTNSLAATDVAAVHAGYKKFRKELLRAGVELWETRSDLGLEAEPVAHSRTSLHVKAFVVDRTYLFVGSFNWDPRAAVYNTEMGIMVDTEALAGGTAEALLDGLDRAAYRLRLDERGRIEWIGLEDGREVVLTSEPQASFWRKLTAGFLGLFPIEGQL